MSLKVPRKFGCQDKLGFKVLRHAESGTIQRLNVLMNKPWTHIALMLKYHLGLPHIFGKYSLAETASKSARQNYNCFHKASLEDHTAEFWQTVQSVKV